MSVKYYPFSFTLNSHEYRIVHIRPTDVNEVEALVELDQVWLHPTGNLNSPVMVSVDVRGYHQMVTRPLAILHDRQPVRNISGGLVFDGPVGFHISGPGKVTLSGIVR